MPRLSKVFTRAFVPLVTPRVAAVIRFDFDIIIFLAELTTVPLTSFVWWMCSSKAFMFWLRFTLY